jgi:hypothetical protein
MSFGRPDTQQAMHDTLQSLIIALTAISTTQTIFQTEGVARRGKSLSAAAVDCAATAASAAWLERRRSALLDPGKPMVQRLASAVADCETGNSSGLAASGLEGALEVVLVGNLRLVPMV